MQARGLDFMSSPEIEEKGGVHVLIGQFPKMYLHYQQYKGRTNRLENKGQCSVIIHSKDVNGQDGNNYINLHLEALKNVYLTQISTYGDGPEH
jgi:hypothetical protein